MLLRRLPSQFLRTGCRCYSTPIQANFAKARQQGGEGPPSATSTSAAQPLSTPLTPGPIKPAASSAASSTTPKSGTPGGMPLRNINYFKNRQDPLALEDSEYPAWLWTALEDGAGKSGAGDEEIGDLYSKSAKQRRLAKKRAAKLAALEGANPVKKVPLHEQTVDLPYATSENTAVKRSVATVGLKLPPTMQGEKAPALKPAVVTIGGESEVKVSPQEAAEARGQLKKELRKKSRASIKEKNFLGQL